jgi:hypothetical protein
MDGEDQQEMSRVVRLTADLVDTILMIPVRTG